MRKFPTTIRCKPDPRSARLLRAAAHAGAIPISRVAVALALLAWRAPSLGAQTEPDTVHLSLAQARSMSIRANPDLLAARAETPVAAGAVRQARIYPYSPMFEAEVQPSLPDDQERRDYLIGIAQEIEWGGQRGLRGDAAESGLSAAGARVADAERRAIAAASLDWLSALSAGRQLDLALRVLELNEQLLAAAQRQLELGDVSGLELNLAQIEVGRARARALSAERRRDAALLDLTRNLGLGPGQIAVPDTTAVEDLGTIAGELSSVTLEQDTLVALALSRRPDLAALSREAERFDAEARLASREALPNLTVRAFQEAEDGAPGRFKLGLGLPIPLLNRNQGRAAELAARAQQVRLEGRALEMRVRAEVGAALRAYQTTAGATEIFERDVLAQARENQALLETAFRGGKVGLAEVLLIRNQLAEAESEYWEAWRSRGAALAELEAATGFSTSPIDTIDRHDEVVQK